MTVQLGVMISSRTAAGEPIVGAAREATLGLASASAADVRSISIVRRCRATSWRIGNRTRRRRVELGIVGRQVGQTDELRPQMALVAAVVRRSSRRACCSAAMRARSGQQGGTRARHRREQPVTTGNDVGSVSIGANLLRWFGVELAPDRYELTPAPGSCAPADQPDQLVARGALPLPRCLSDRLVPYLSLASALVTQINDTQYRHGWVGGGTMRARCR